MKNIEIDGLNFELLIKEEDILCSIKRLSQKLNDAYHGEWPVILVVLNGAIFFAGELLKHIEGFVEFSCVKVHSYDGEVSSGNIIIDYIPCDIIKNKKVLLIEDIVDSGLTLDFLTKELKKRGAKDVECVTLLFKPHKYNYPNLPKYIGFSIGDEFVVGYGMDLNQKGRGLKNIYKNINN